MDETFDISFLAQSSKSSGSLNMYIIEGKIFSFPISSN